MSIELDSEYFAPYSEYQDKRGNAFQDKLIINNDVESEALVLKQLYEFMSVISKIDNSKARIKLHKKIYGLIK